MRGECCTVRSRSKITFFYIIEKKLSVNEHP